MKATTIKRKQSQCNIDTSKQPNKKPIEKKLKQIICIKWLKGVTSSPLVAQTPFDCQFEWSNNNNRKKKKRKQTTTQQQKKKTRNDTNKHNTADTCQKTMADKARNQYFFFVCVLIPLHSAHLAIDGKPWKCYRFEIDLLCKNNIDIDTFFPCAKFELIHASHL